MSRTGYYVSRILSTTGRKSAHTLSHIHVVSWQENAENEMAQQMQESKEKLSNGEILAIILKGTGIPRDDDASSPISPAVHSYGAFVDKATDSIPHTEDFLLSDLPRILGMRPLNRPSDTKDNTSPVQHEVANNPKALEKIEPVLDRTYSEGALELVARIAVRNKHQRVINLSSEDGTKEASIALASGDILITNAQKTLVGQEAEPKYDPNRNERTWTAKVHLAGDNTTKGRQ